MDNKLIFFDKNKQIKKSYELSEFCLDLNLDINENDKDKKTVVDKIENMYDRIPRFGNYIIHIETNKKYEIEVPKEKDFFLVLNYLDICLSDRKVEDLSPLKLIGDIIESFWWTI